MEHCPVGCGGACPQQIHDDALRGKRQDQHLTLKLFTVCVRVCVCVCVYKGEGKRERKRNVTSGAAGTETSLCDSFNNSGSLK